MRFALVRASDGIIRAMCSGQSYERYTWGITSLGGYSNHPKYDKPEIKNLDDINKYEIVMLVTLAFLIIFFGFYPLPLMETFNVSVNSLIDNYETALILK